MLGLVGAQLDAGESRRPILVRLGAGLTWGVGLLVAACYVLAYLRDPNLPGNQPAMPLGWWGWFDQGVTLRSTAALAGLDLDPARHHYPLGYAILGLPFYLLAPNHAFFAVDLLCLVGLYVGFIRVAERLGLHGGVAALLFAMAVLPDAALFRQWVIPWNTTPAAAFTWLLLAAAAAWLDGVRRPLLVGALTGAVVACRPSEAVVVLPSLLTLLAAERTAWRHQGRTLLRFVAGGALVLLPVVALHLAIYGLAQSNYMRSSAGIGFTLHDFAWKAYVIGVDPFPWFKDGEGLLQHAHWIALGLAGLVPALLRGARDRMVAATLIVHGVLYIAYVDLLPMGLWRFLNIHYFVWAVPGYALVAALLLRDLVRPGWPRGIALASLAAAALVLCVRVVPVPVAADQPAKAIDFAGPNPPFLDTFFSGRLALQDGRGTLPDNTASRTFIYPGGVRVVGLRRDIVGPVAWLPGRAPQGFETAEPTARWAPRLRLAWPPAWFDRAPPTGIPIPTE